MEKTYQRSFENFLALQRVSLKTKEAYLRAVTELSNYHNMPAANLTNDQVQNFLHYNIQEKQLAWSSCNVLFCGLKKYYREYLGHSETEFSIPPRTRSKKIPMLLSRDEVTKILGQQPT